MRKSLILASILNILLICSCKENFVYSHTEEINQEGWKYESPAEFSFDIESTSTNYDMVLSVEHKETFRYDNLYVNIITTFPDGSSTDNIVSLNIGNGLGGFHGECNNGYCTENIPLQENFKFKESGNHKISVKQHSRIKNLGAVKSISLKLKKRTDK